MKQSEFLTQVHMTFKTWKQHGSAVFKSLGKVITVAVLTISALSSFTSSSFAQTDSVIMEEIEIRSSGIPQLLKESAKVVHTISKEEIELMPANNLSDVLEQIASADIRSRGADGIQSDISMRGGNFEQTLILLDGISINDVQTGHHNMNIPVNLNAIERIEILQGPGNRYYGLNAYSGAINIVTKTPENRNLGISTFYGSDHTFGTAASVNLGTETFKSLLAINYSQSDGYIDEPVNNTDYTKGNIFYKGVLRLSKLFLHINAGYNHKAFGANDFYTPSFPWQYEKTSAGFASIQTTFGKAVKISPSLWYRRHQDRFELFREDIYQRQNDYFINGNDTAGFGGGYYYSGHNYHLSNVWGGKIIARTAGRFGKTSFGTDIRYEQLFSNVLGADMKTSLPVPGSDFGQFTKSGNRNQMNSFIEHYAALNNFAFSAGGALALSPDFKPLTTGGIDLSYSFSDDTKIYTSFNRSARLPSYTDLYYSGPTNIGNPDLKPETALSCELGIKNNNPNFSYYLNTYLRYGNNTIDWVKNSEEEQWQSQNSTKLRTYGSEAGIVFNFSNTGLKTLRLSYTYNNTEVQDSEFISKYVMDYLQHQVKTSVNHRFLKNFRASWQIRLEDRAGSYTDYNSENNPVTKYKPILLADAKLSYSKNTFRIFGELSNILDTEYHEISSVVMPGREFRIGVDWRLRK
ncbi:MAG: TonB-dependent receptor [Bacteroidota bacterium]|nr:TonB-dependent receptor [Bacteroidota bacterium]